MSTYYTFSNQYANMTEPLEPLEKVPSDRLQPMMAERAQRMMSQPNTLQNRPHVANCCTGTQPCKTWVSFRPTYGGCGNMWMRWNEVTGPRGATAQGDNYEVGKKAPGIWVADLNPLQLEHQRIHGAHWWPEMAGHPQARQYFAQYLTSTLQTQSDPNAKRIDSLADTLPYTSCRYGPPQFTSF